MAAAQLTAGGVGIETAAGAHAYGDVAPLQQLAKILRHQQGNKAEHGRPAIQLFGVAVEPEAG